MAKLIYSSIASVDGYVADEHGNFDWAAPDDEVHAFVNELERSVGTYLYGRRMYDVMVAWETMPTPRISRPSSATTRRSGGRPTRSSTPRRSTQPRAPRRRSSASFDPEAVRQLKTKASRDLSVGGPGLAAHALAAGLVDECHLFVAPVIVGGGTRFLPEGLRLDLELAEERRFANGTVYLHYRTRARRARPGSDRRRA